MNLVFIITDVNYGGGGERVLITLSNYFQKKYGWKISIVSLLKTINKNPYEIDKNINIYYVNNEYETLEKSRIQRGINKLLKIKKLNQILVDIEKKEQINVLIGIGFENSWYLSLLLKDKKVKRVGTQHTSYFEFDKKKSLEKKIWKYLLKKLDKFVVLTLDAENYFFDKVGLNNVLTISNPNPYELKNIDYKKEKIAICVGRLSEEKQIDKLIEIWAKLSLDKKEGWKLLIIGDGPSKEKVRQKILELEVEKEIELIGKIPDIEKYYKKASILISVSKSESFSMVLIEGGTFKICPVFYDCPSGPRNIIKNNQTGFLIKLDDEKEMIRKLENLLKNEVLRNKIGENAFKDLENYKIESICKKWKEVLTIL